MQSGVVERLRCLARELAALRLAIGEVATRDYLRSELDKLAERLNPGRADGRLEAKGR